MRDISRTGTGFFAKFLSIVITGFILLLWWLFLAPTSVGGAATFVMVSGTSMQPLLHSGDLAIAREKSEYKNGDLIIFMVKRGAKAGAVIHRITSGSIQDGWKTQGDNNDYLDQWIVPNDQIRGEVWISIDGVGNYLAWLKVHPLQFGGIMSLLVVLLSVPRRPKRISQQLAFELTRSVKESSRAGRTNLEYASLLTSLIATLVVTAAVIWMWLLNLLSTLQGYTALIAALMAGLLSVLLIYRLFDGVGISEPNKSLFALSGRLHSIQKLSFEVEAKTQVSSAVQLRRIADKYRLPILHMIHPNSGQHSFLLLTKQKGAFQWVPPMGLVVEEPTNFHQPHSYPWH